MVQANVCNVVPWHICVKWSLLHLSQKMMDTYKCCLAIRPSSSLSPMSDIQDRGTVQGIYPAWHGQFTNMALYLLDIYGVQELMIILLLRKQEQFHTKICGKLLFRTFKT